MYSALIFDCDGTLVDSMPAHYVAWHATLTRYGLSMSEDQFYAWGGWPTVKVATELIRRADKVGELDPVLIGDEKELAFEAHIEKVQAIAPVRDQVLQHYGKIPLAVATGACRRICEELLKAVDLIDKFAAIVTCDDVVRSKPDPDIYLAAAERIGVRPELCCVYEDTDPGIAAGRAAGMAVVDVRDFYRPRRITA